MVMLTTSSAGGAKASPAPKPVPPLPARAWRRVPTKRASRPRSLRTVFAFLRGRHPGVTWHQFRYCWQHNFFPYRALDYDFTTYAPEDYFPDSVTGSPGGEDIEVEACCNDKVIFALYIRSIGGETPEVLAEHAGGRLILHADVPDFAELLERHGELIVKPRDSSGGGGVRLVRPGDPDPEPRPGEFATPRVRQHPYAAAIYPNSANTVRMLTAWDYDREDVFIAAAAHRFGSARGGCVDNWGVGGLGASVDLGTGTLGPAMRQANFDPSRRRWASHPDTGAPIEGVVIPRFHEMCENLLEVARRFPRRYVGWDIVMTEEGWVFLEANRVPSLALFQMHRPVLLDPRLRRFFEREGMI